MAIGPAEPTGADYSARSTDAVKSVLIEIAQTLGSFQGKFAVVGGAVPWLLLNNEEMPHVGTLDVDLGLDHEALGDGEYATLVGALQEQGYAQSMGASPLPAPARRRSGRWWAANPRHR